MPGFSSELERRGDAAVFRLRGPLTDADECFVFLEAYRNAVRAGVLRLVLDLSEVPRLSSGGVGILASCHACASNGGGTLCVFGLGKQPRMILEVVRLLSILRVFESQDEALSAARVV